MRASPYRTAFGDGFVVHEGRDIVTIELPGAAARATSPGAPPNVRSLVEALEAYYAGKASLVAPGWMIAAAGTTPLMRDVYAYVSRLRPGETATYREVAEAVGRPGAARAVGAAMARNPFPPVIPCHRVVGSDGRLRGYGGGLSQKRRLLDMETAHAR